MFKACLLVVIGLALSGCAVEVDAVALLDAVNSGEGSSYLHGLLVSLVVANPTASLLVGGLTVAMPLLNMIANSTSNPHDNAMLIALNKVLQLLSGTSAKNQPDVLPLSDMLTNHPSKWPDVLSNRMKLKGTDLHIESATMALKDLETRPF